MFVAMRARSRARRARASDGTRSNAHAVSALVTGAVVTTLVVACARDDRERGDGDGGAGDDLDRWIARRVGGRRRRASDGRDLWVVETRADGDADVSRGTKRGDGREDAGRWRVAG